MNSFEYSAPRTLEEAASLLAEQWGKTEILAGGTDLVTCLKQKITAPSRLVSLRNISGLKGISEEGDSVVIGAMTSLAQVAEEASIQNAFPAITTAIQGIGSPQILNVGTVGGDLCQRPRCWYFRNGYGLLGRKDGTSLVTKGDNRYHAIFGNDGPAYFVSVSSLGPPLIALGATLTATGPDGTSREIKAREFFQTPKSENERETVLAPNEILTEIRIPRKGWKNATYEVRHRHGFDWPYVTASVAYRMEGGGARDARIVLGHVAPVPWFSAEGAQALNWKEIHESSAAAAGAAAVKNAKPLSRNAYKIPLVKTAVKRAVLAAAA